MEDFVLSLFDRLDTIRNVEDAYHLSENAYLSFSGGKDSTILHHLIDMALPGNAIPRVYIDTGIEYFDVRKFVLSLASADARFVVIKPSQNIRSVLETYGYPFKSKEHSLRVMQFNRGSDAAYLRRYIDGYSFNGHASRFCCPATLKYQFVERGKYNYSNLCCFKLKKGPVKLWERANCRHVPITGMRNSEGGNRARLGCVLKNPDGSLFRFHPLAKVSDDFEDWFLNKFDIRLCRLYYPPFSFKRTGCKGCPFALELQDELDVMGRYLPNERKQCEAIWAYVYSEYRRLGYRLKPTEQMRLL